MAKKVNKYEELLFSLLPSFFPEEPVIREYRFHIPKEGEKQRQWRFDFAYEYYKIAFEVEGGTWSGGRHVNPIGFAKDCEKYNAAVSLGWKVFRLTPAMITEEYLASIFS